MDRNLGQSQPRKLLFCALFFHGPERAWQCTQGLIETLGSMVIFDENQAVSDINKYEFLNTIYVQMVNFLVI